MLSANIIPDRRWLIVLAVALSGCGDGKRPVAATGPRVVLPEEGVNIESYLSEGAKVKGKLTSPYMLRFQKSDTPYSEFPRTLHVDFYTDSLQIESQMDARYGKYLNNQNKVLLRDSVVVKNILRGDTLRTKELWWDQQTQKFSTDKPVEIYQKDKILFGDGMDADQNFRWYTIRNFKGSILTSQNAMPAAK